MYCTECGAKLIEAAKFCSECGTKVVEPEKPGERIPEAAEPVETAAAEPVEEAAANAAKSLEETVTEAADEAATEAAEAAGETAANVADAVEVIVEPPAPELNEAPEIIRPQLSPAPQATERKPQFPAQASVQEAAFQSAPAQAAPAYTAAGAAAAAMPKEPEKKARKDKKAAADFTASPRKNMLTAAVIMASAALICMFLSILPSLLVSRIAAIVSCCVLTYLAVRRVTYPHAAYALPASILAVLNIVMLARSLIMSVFSNFYSYSEGLLPHLYRTVLVILAILLFVHSTEYNRGSKVLNGIIVFFTLLLAAYHAYYFATTLRLGRAVLMYHLAGFLFFAAYFAVETGWKKIKAVNTPETIKAEDISVSPSVKADTADTKASNAANETADNKVSETAAETADTNAAEPQSGAEAPEEISEEARIADSIAALTAAAVKEAEDGAEEIIPKAIDAAGETLTEALDSAEDEETEAVAAAGETEAEFFDDPAAETARIIEETVAVAAENAEETVSEAVQTASVDTAQTADKSASADSQPETPKHSKRFVLRCNRCGAALPADSAFCNKCGYPVGKI